MVIIIGQAFESLCLYLEGNGIQATGYRPEHVPSLTALLLASSQITDIVLPQGEDKNWSVGHVLSAAKQLQGKGRMIFLGAGARQPSLISVAADKETLLALLKAPKKPLAGTAGGTGGRRPPESPAAAARNCVKIRPLDLPPDKIFFLGVIGAQHRIGCTTQAVGLWHYCKALGFDPAVVASREQIAEIAGTMHSQEIPGGYRIEGVPFVTDTALSYDCYILDIGPGNMREALRSADQLILVAGSKPWELQHTAAALRAARGKEMLILLSFSSQSDAKALQPLFGRQTVTTLPWMPELWHPSMDAMAIYDVVLRPVLERLLSRCEPQLEDEPAG